MAVIKSQVLIPSPVRFKDGNKSMWRRIVNTGMQYYNHSVIQRYILPTEMII